MVFSVVVTGEIGAGKSTLVKVWGEMGANVFELDALAKKYWSRPEIREAAERRWGAGVYENGTPVFKKIAEKVYKDFEEYRFSANLIHPPTMVEISREVRNVGGWVVVECPLLYETGWFDLVDCVVCVTSTDDLRMERSASRGWREEEIANRERFLMGSLKKQAMSDIVLCNIGGLEAWETRAREIGNLMLKMSTVHELSVFCKDHSESRRIASILLDRRLVAGANITEVESIYRWKGDINDVHEWRLCCYTTERNLRDAMECVRQNHSYEAPAVAASEVARSNYQTLKWVVENCE
jgi:dephospho-CoA kinase